MSIYLQILTVFFITIVLHIFYLIIIPKIRKKKLLFESYNTIFIGWLFSFLLISLIVVFKHYVDNDTMLFNIFIQTFILFVIPTFNFVIKPYLLSIRFSKKRDLNLEKILEKRNRRIKVYSSEITNAFAMGVTGFGKIIIIGNSLKQFLETKNIEGIILHEYAHHKYKHLHRLYLYTFIVSFLVSSILILANHYLREYIHPAMIVGFCGALYGLFIYYITGFQKKMEYEADSYAAKEIGSNLYIQTLKKLNDIKNGSLEKKSITHPLLSERIKNLNGIL
tara:strand:- start:161 stop:997 length:837 start_codon:yes stop_codon:yes gene_type:complete